MGKKLFFIIYILFGCITILLYITTFINMGLMEFFFLNTSYYLILLLCILWVITIFYLLGHYKPNIKRFFVKYRFGILASLMLSFIIFLSVKPTFRVLSDESNLVAVSKSMIYEKRVDNVLMGACYYEHFYPIERSIPKRPLLFPFLIHILHIFLGYRVENVFILNFFILFILFFLIFILIKELLKSDIWAFAAIILVASQPIISQIATSGGFDLFSILFLLISFLALRWFLKKPSGLQFSLLWINLLMLTNIRYEGIIYFAIIICYLLVFRYVKVNFFMDNIKIIYICTPMILLLTFWQRLIIKGRGFEVLGKPFSLKFFLEHNKIFFKGLLNYDFFLPYATIVNLIGLLSLIYFAYLFFSTHKMQKRNKIHLIAICTICISIYWFLINSFHIGRIDEPCQGRIFAFAFLLLSLSALMLTTKIKIFRQKPVYILILSVLIFILYHPVSVQDSFSRGLTLPREYRFVLNFLKHENEKGKNSLIISKRPGFYTIHDYGAVDFNYANKQSRSIVVGYRNHLCEEIYIVQDIEYTTLEPTEETRLGPKYIIEPLREIQNNSRFFTRISRLVLIKDEIK